MFADGLRCVDCGTAYDFGPEFYGCAACERAGVHGALEVTYDYDRLGRSLSKGWADRIFVDRLWAFRSFLPIADETNIVTLGEGATPVLPLTRRSPNPGPRIILKNEALNPTWAFKDRFHTVSVSMAKELGYGKLVASTTGNHGLSLAAYGAAAGMSVTVFVDDRSPEVQTAAMRAMGAEVHAGRDRRRHLLSYVDEGNAYPSTYMTPMPVSTPYGVEGYKTIAYEVFLQLGAVPNHFVFPTAAGDGLFGPWKGFKELMKLGFVDDAPKMHAVQSVSANWLVETWRSNSEYALRDPDAGSVALSIGDDTGGYMCVGVLKESGGSAVEVTDDQIVRAQRHLAEEGMLVEPASAASLAGAWQLHADGVIKDDETCLCLLTGSAMKWPASLRTIGAAREKDDISGL